MLTKGGIMKKYYFEDEVISKKNAIKYFPSFFGSDYILLNDKSLKELDERYLEYCKKYFTKFSMDDNYDRVMIKKAYDYISYMLIASKHTYKLKSEITKTLLDDYDNLVNTISKYRFNAVGEGSYGDNQNKTNKNIIFEISLLRPYLIKILTDLDRYFENIADVNSISYNDNQLMERLEKLEKKLIEVNETLIMTGKHYHRTWNSTNRRKWYGGKATESDLGKSKIEWKKAKNYACRVVLDFYREIDNLYTNSILDGTIINSIDEAYEYQKQYQKATSKIVSGPNYYSYLSDQQKTELTAENTLRKKLRKSNQGN